MAVNTQKLSKVANIIIKKACENVDNNELIDLLHTKTSNNGVVELFSDSLKTIKTLQDNGVNNEDIKKIIDILVPIVKEMAGDAVDSQIFASFEKFDNMLNIVNDKTTSASTQKKKIGRPPKNQDQATKVIKKKQEAPIEIIDDNQSIKSDAVSIINNQELHSLLYEYMQKTDAIIEENKKLHKLLINVCKHMPTEAKVALFDDMLDSNWILTLP